MASCSYNYINYMQFNELYVVNGAPSTDASAVGHVLSARK